MKKTSIFKLLILSAILTYAMGSSFLKLLPIMVNDLITFKQVTPPIITINGKETVNLVVGDDYEDAGVTAADNIDVKTIGTVNTFKPDTYTIIYIAEDTDGNITEITRTVIVKPLDELLPHDTNLYFAPENEKGYLYFADPQPSENGKNRVVRVNYETMTFNEEDDSIELTEDAYLLDGKDYSNPHSVDRAGKTNRFYVRTQNSYSFDVIEVKDGKLQYLKTVPLSVYIDGTEVKYSPRAFGAYNAKYDIQLLSGRNSSAKYSMLGIVDVKTDEVIKHIYKPISGDGSATTGHAKWLDVDHFAVTDRGNHSINVYKIFINEEGEIDARNTDNIDVSAPVHAINRVKNPQNKLDLNTFYIMAESVDINGTKTPPFIQKLVFNAETGKFNAIHTCASTKSCNSGTSCGTAKSCDTTTSCDTAQSHASEIALFLDTDYKKLKEKKIPATTHHINTTLDGKHLVVPVYDGKIYKVDRVTMSIVETLDTGVEKGLGAAHIEFSNSLGVAIITNHWSPYITILDVSNDEFKLKGYVKIYRDGHHDVHNPDEKHLMQPHFAQISEDGKYFYTFASQDNGRFVRVNLEEVLKLEIDDEKVFQFENNDDDTEVMKSIDVEGAPEQAHS